MCVRLRFRKVELSMNIIDNMYVRLRFRKEVALLLIHVTTKSCLCVLRNLEILSLKSGVSMRAKTDKG